MGKRRSVPRKTKGGAQKAVGGNAVKRSGKRKPPPPPELKAAIELHQRGQLDQAEQAYRSLLTRIPDNGDTLRFLGILRRQRGDLAEAVMLLEKAVQVSPKSVLAWTELGDTLLGVGRFENAHFAYTHSIQLDAKHAAAHCGLGFAFMEIGDIRSSLTHFRTAYRIESRNPKHCMGLAEVCLRNGLLPEARQYAEEAVRIAPSTVRFNWLLGNILTESGEIDEAEKAYHKALDLDQNCEEAMVGMAHVFENRKQSDEALRYIEAFLDRVDVKTILAPTAYIHTRVCLKLKEYDKALHLLDAVIEAGKERPSGIMSLHYRRGAVLEKMNRYDEAWDAWSAGANMLPDSPNPEQDITLHANHQINTIYTAEKLAGYAHSKLDTDRPIFIVGMPRSGTTLVEQILGAHSSVAMGGELMALTDVDVIGRVKEKLGLTEPLIASLGQLKSGHLDRIGKMYLHRLDEVSSDAPHVTDKLPHNFVNLGLISLLFPKCHVINCMRHPLDNCLSCFASQLPQGHRWAYDLGKLGSAYVAYRKLMKHWHEVLDISILDVQYEELVADQEAKSREIISFVGLDWEQACLRFYENKEYVRTLSADQVSQPIYSTSKGRHQHFESHLKPLQAIVSEFL